jgi:hypothetical protein
MAHHPPNREEPVVNRFPLARNLIAFILVIVACPASLYVTVGLGCAALGYTGKCAMDSAVLSPIILMAAGFIAGILSRGWTGILIVVFGVVIGMFTLLFVADALGNPVPIDPISGAIAGVWFMTPTLFSYGVARGVMRIIGWAMKPEDAKAVEQQSTEAPSA